MSGRRLLDSLDFPTIVATLVLVAVGLFAIAAATMEQVERQGLWRTQLMWLAVAVVAATVVVWVDYRLWAELAFALHGLVIVLLVAVLLVGTEVGGNRSWLVVGPLRAQPSEFAKWTTCLVLAVYLARRVRGSMGLRQLMEMSLLVAVPVGLILLQPDMGTALIFLPISLSALLIGGVRWKVIVGILVIGVLLTPVAWTQLKGYQKERIMTVFDPGRDPSGVGYQVRQSKIAIGSGGHDGQGPVPGNAEPAELPAGPAHGLRPVRLLGRNRVSSVPRRCWGCSTTCSGEGSSQRGRPRTAWAPTSVSSWLPGSSARWPSTSAWPSVGCRPSAFLLPFLSYGGSALVSAVCGVALIVNVRTRRFVN